MKALSVSRYIAAVFSLLFLASAGQAQTPAYQLIDLGTVGGTTSHAYGINDLGQVVGDSSTAGDAATDATFFDVDFTGAVNRIDMGRITQDQAATAFGINNVGQIVGYSGTIFTALSAFFYTDGTPPMTLDFGDPVQLCGINDTGRVLGTLFDVQDAVDFAFTVVFAPNVISTRISRSGYITRGYAINSNGQMAGFTGPYVLPHVTQFPTAALFTEADGTVAQSNTFSRAFAISNAGVLAGNHSMTMHGNPLAATFVQNGSTLVTTDLGTLGGSTSAAYGINSAGEVAGNSDTTGDVASDGFIYTGAAGMQDLNSLVGTSPAATNIQTSTPGNAINEWGQIPAIGEVGGDVHALRLDPTSPLTTTNGLTQDCKIVSRLSYKQVPAFTGTVGGSQGVTGVSLPDGTAGSGGSSTYGLNRDVKERFVANPSSFTPIASDAMTLTGTDSDTVVIQMTFSATQATALFGNPANARLCYYQSGSWARQAVNNNTGGAPVFAGNTRYISARDFQLGRYGVFTDATRNLYLVWAVVNHATAFGTAFGVAMDPDTLKTLKSYTRPGTTSTLKIDGYTGYTYQLQKKASLTGTWATVGPVLSGSTGTLLTFTDTDSHGPAFYRVLLGP